MLREPGQAGLEIIANPMLTDTNVLLKVRFVGFCGSRRSRAGCSRLQKCSIGGFRAVIKLLEAQRFPLDKAVSLVVPLEQATDALRS